MPHLCWCSHHWGTPLHCIQRVQLFLACPLGFGVSNKSDMGDITLQDVYKNSARRDDKQKALSSSRLWLIKNPLRPNFLTGTRCSVTEGNRTTPCTEQPRQASREGGRSTTCPAAMGLVVAFGKGLQASAGHLAPANAYKFLL